MSKELAQRARALLDAIRPAIEELSRLEWREEEGFLTIIFRAIVRRQYDALRAIVSITEASQGFAAACLVRPACEELIWAKYLVGLNRNQAERLVVLVATHELHCHVKAQENYAGAKGMTELGFTRQFVKETQAHHRSVKAELRKLGKELGWPDGDMLPKVSFLARTTKSTEMYNFIYHGSSRFIHFSVAELLRRAWGKPGSITIDSGHFGDYWSTFALYWGIRLFTKTFITIEDACRFLEDKQVEIDSEALLAAAKAVGETGQVPIITREELLWPERQTDIPS